MNKQEILEEFDNTFEEDIIGFKNGSIMEPIHLSEWLSSALDRYAMSVVTESVPEPIDPKAEGCPEDCLCGYCLSEVIPLNDFREATLNKAREITS